MLPSGWELLKYGKKCNGNQLLYPVLPPTNFLGGRVEEGREEKENK